MSRFNNNRGPNGGEPGSGLARCAAMDWQANLAMRRACENTPVRFLGETWLGWAVMPKPIRRAFLAGEGNFQRIQFGRVLN